MRDVWVCTHVRPWSARQSVTLLCFTIGRPRATERENCVRRCHRPHEKAGDLNELVGVNHVSLIQTLCEPMDQQRYGVQAMSPWRRIREFLALGADVIGVAIGLGVIVAAVVGLWNQASLHLPEPWLTLILIGVFLSVAGSAGRAVRYLPMPNSPAVATPRAAPGATADVSSGPGKLRADLVADLGVVE